MTSTDGAAAMGDDVTRFFTFWGLNVLRRPEKLRTDDKKSTLQTMFGKMMPKGTGRLGLSKMNFAGMGAPLMKGVMKQANAMSLEELVDSAREQGVKFAGVAAYLGGADEANVNLFIWQLAKPLPRACAETAGPGRKRRRRRSKASAISRPPSWSRKPAADAGPS